VVQENLFLVGFISLIWYLVRTGAKPSRAGYPCQRVASVNAQLWLATAWVPIATVVRRGKRAVAVAVPVLVLLVMTLLVATSRPMVAVAQEQMLGLPVTGRSATSFPASDLFVVNGTTGRDGGVMDLLHLMGDQDVHFYQSAASGATFGPDGLFGRDDVVLIKVNSQWDQRGGTNTDLLFAVITTLATHPEGFTGEIIVADNGQDQYGSAGSGGSLDWAENNAANYSQSVQDVVDALTSTCNVSTYLWDDITLQHVDEYHEGNLMDGYIVNTTVNAATGLMVSYPKFRTKYGTFISFKHGVWNPRSETYDGERLKVINMPVLKTHGGYGVTASVKHYMGVVSDKLTSSLGVRSHSTIGQGGMGTEMAETRMPTLNLLDAIWINAAPRNGPRTSYGEAVQVNIIAASRDPVALDYWATKYVLRQAAEQLGYTDLTTLDPDYTGTWGAFGNWLRRSQQVLSDAGYPVTANETHMNVFVHHKTIDSGTVNAKQPSTITCHLPYAEVPIGSAISVTGSIQPTPSEATVTLTYTRPDDAVLNRTCPTAADGTYDDLYAPNLAGEWQVIASWPGDPTLDGAASTTRTFTVTTAPTGIPVELIAFGVLGSLVVVLLAMRRII
jgi:hypothetical protein